MTQSELSQSSSEKKITKLRVVSAMINSPHALDWSKDKKRREGFELSKSLKKNIDKLYHD